MDKEDRELAEVPADDENQRCYGRYNQWTGQKPGQKHRQYKFYYIKLVGRGEHATHQGVKLIGSMGNSVERQAQVKHV